MTLTQNITDQGRAGAAAAPSCAFHTWINHVGRWLLNSPASNCGVMSTSINQLEADIRAFIERYNENPRPNRWDQVRRRYLLSVKRFCQKTDQTYRQTLECQMTSTLTYNRCISELRSEMRLGLARATTIDREDIRWHRAPAP
jgi:hypothetical protein